MPFDLKQKIENHPVVVYTLAVIAGILIYEGGLRVTGRTTVFVSEIEKIQKFEGQAAELTASKLKISELQAQLANPQLQGNFPVKFNRVSYTLHPACPKSEPIAVSEYYDIQGDADPDKFVMIIGTNHSQFHFYKASDGNPMRVDSTRRTLIYHYCFPTAQRIEVTRRFLNPTNGTFSKQIVFNLET